MKHIIPLVLFCPVVLFGQQAPVSGQVFANQKPLSHCSVLIDHQQATLTDSAGFFYFKTIAPGRHHLYVSHTGMEAYEQTVVLAAGAPVTLAIVLLEQSQILDDVVVTGVAGRSTIKNTPVAVAAIARRDMQYSSNTNIIDALVKTVPGVTAVTTGPNISKPFIRGLGYNRVLTLYDGIRQEGQQWGDEHGAEIDPYGVARAEVVKGPASLTYGSDAVAGVVNLIPDYPNGKEGKLNADALLEYQTNNRMIGSSLGLNKKKKHFFWSVRGSAKAATNYTNAVDARVYGTGFTEANASAMAGFSGNTYNTCWQAAVYNNLQEIPDGSRDSLTRHFTVQTEESNDDNITQRPVVAKHLLTSYRIVPLHQHIQHFRVYNKTQLRMRGGELNALLGFQQNRRREYNHPRHPSQAGLDMVLNTVNYEGKFHFNSWKGILFTTGINGMYQNNSHRDATDFPIPAYALFDAGAFVLAKREWERFTVSGGIRYDVRSIRWNAFYTKINPATGFQYEVPGSDTAGALLRFSRNRQSFSGVSASAGFTYRLLPQLTLKLNTAKGYRAPNITETGANGLDPGAHIYYIGNSRFKPETNWQQDVGLLYQDKSVSATLETFYNHISNFIFLQKVLDENGQPLQVIAGNNTYQYKQTSALLYGMEASVGWQPEAHSWLLFKSSAAMVSGINKDKALQKKYGDGAKYLPLIPPFRTLSTARITLPFRSQAVSNIYVQTEFEHYSRQKRFYAADNTETATAGYNLVHAGAGISFTGRHSNNTVKLYVNANNVFNVAYQSHLSRLKYFEYYSASPSGRTGIYNMGRNISLKVIFGF